MKQILGIIIPLMLLVALILNQALPADAAKKTTKKRGMSQEVLTDITQKVDDLTKKIYERELYTPEDSKTLISVKLQLDAQMDNLSEASFAPLYYKIGNIYKLRNEEKDAIVCYQTILENFSDTAYGPKAKDALAEMGVELKLSNDEEKDENLSDEF